MKSFALLLLVFALFTLTPPGAVFAGGHGAQTVVGVGAGLLPDYEGSRHYRPIPMFFVRSGLADGRALTWRGTALEADLLPGGPWQVGPLLRYRFARDRVDNPRVRRLRPVDEAVEVGGFAGWSQGGWGVKLSAAGDLADGHGGYWLEGAGSYRRFLGRAASLQLTLSATWADDDYMDSYFSVDADNALRSGLRTYRAGAGVKDAGLGLTYTRTLQGNWGWTGLLRYSRLLGDAADSPLVADEGRADQLLFGLLFSYRL